MTTNTRDLLPVCNNQGVPLEDFQQTFCRRCLQPECSRSVAGLSKFEARIHDWKSRLFQSPARMPPQDPRFAVISAQKFVEVPVGGPVEIRGAWLDPRDLETPEEDFSNVPDFTLEEESPGLSLDSNTVPEVAPVPEAPVAPAPSLLNTPFESGTMVGGHVKREAPPVKDPWSAPEPVSEVADGVKIVKPGEKIRFGS